MAGAICAKVGAPYFLVEQDLHIGVTIGISVYPADGAQTEAQLNYLRRHRCDPIQGHYFSRPLPAQQLTDMLLQNKRIA